MSRRTGDSMNTRIRDQSSPDPQVGRYLRCARGSGHPSCFNPRPIFRSGATWTCVMAAPSQVFQSSPDLQVGRYKCSVPGSAPASCFNPRPTFRSGATGTSNAPVANPWFQSSPDLQVGRYVSVFSILAAVFCFNPRPTFRSGATTARQRRQRHHSVSILARPSGRALRASGAGSKPSPKFQSSPDLQVGRYVWSTFVRETAPPFQSSPDLQVGRYGAYFYQRKFGGLT